ncbi:hypothetical protein NC651_029897 [Populus alba x Populus x berolinensis]|nr:hypothetical protein NC651_029897 [Populus alba x Populus x berolinensis]
MMANSSLAVIKVFNFWLLYYHMDSTLLYFKRDSSNSSPAFIAFGGSAANDVWFTKELNIELKISFITMDETES